MGALAATTTTVVTSAYATGRANTLYLDTDPMPLTLDDKSEKPSYKVRLGFEALSFVPTTHPCILSWRTLPMLYQGLQWGAQCAFRTGHSHILAVELFPEIAVRSDEENFSRLRPSVKIALTQALHLKTFGLDGALVYGRISGKFSGKENQNTVSKLSKSGYSTVQLQKWSDIVESNYSVGWSLRHALSETDKTQAWAIRISYAETLPYELRRFGFLEETAAVNLKTIDMSARRTFGAITFGGGLGYAAITIDTIRLALPYPTLTFDYTW